MQRTTTEQWKSRNHSFLHPQRRMAKTQSCQVRESTCSAIPFVKSFRNRSNEAMRYLGTFKCLKIIKDSTAMIITGAMMLLTFGGETRVEARSGCLKKMAQSISLHGVEFLGIFCIIIFSKLLRYKIHTQKCRNKNTVQWKKLKFPACQHQNSITPESLAILTEIKNKSKQNYTK